MHIVNIIAFEYSLKFEHINIDPEDKFMLVEVKINNNAFVIRSVYALIIDKPKFFDALLSAIADLTDNDLVIDGDWNLVLNNRLDKDKCAPHSDRSEKKD